MPKRFEMAKLKQAPLHLLRSEADHTAALAEIDALWANESNAAQERLELLAVLVELYEREHHALPSPDPIAAIRFRLEQLGMSQADLGRTLGSGARASEVMHRRRALSLTMIRRLHAELKIPAEVLIAPSKKPMKAKAKARQTTAGRAHAR